MATWTHWVIGSLVRGFLFFDSNISFILPVPRNIWTREKFGEDFFTSFELNLLTK
jgi:hypothetical protein